MPGVHGMHVYVPLVPEGHPVKTASYVCAVVRVCTVVGDMPMDVNCTSLM